MRERLHTVLIQTHFCHTTMEKVHIRPQCGQPSDRGRLKNRTTLHSELFARHSASWPAWLLAIRHFDFSHFCFFLFRESLLPGVFKKNNNNNKLVTLVTSPSRGQSSVMSEGCLVGSRILMVPSNELVNSAPGVRITPLTKLFLWPTSYVWHNANTHTGDTHT